MVEAAFYSAVASLGNDLTAAILILRNGLLGEIAWEVRPDSLRAYERE